MSGRASRGHQERRPPGSGALLSFLCLSTPVPFPTNSGATFLFKKKFRFMRACALKSGILTRRFVKISRVSFSFQARSL